MDVALDATSGVRRNGGKDLPISEAAVEIFAELFLSIGDVCGRADLDQLPSIRGRDIDVCALIVPEHESDPGVIALNAMAFTSAKRVGSVSTGGDPVGEALSLCLHRGLVVSSAHSRCVEQAARGYLLQLQKEELIRRKGGHNRKLSIAYAEGPSRPALSDTNAPDADIEVSAQSKH